MTLENDIEKIAWIRMHGNIYSLPFNDLYLGV